MRLVVCWSILVVWMAGCGSSGGDAAADSTPADDDSSDVGADSSGGGAPPGDLGDGGSGGGGASACRADLDAERLCQARVGWVASCETVDQERLYNYCLDSDGFILDRFEPCIQQALFGCYQIPCGEDPGVCMQEGFAYVRSDLVDLDAERECQGWDQQGDEPLACTTRHKGALKECVDRAKLCGASYNDCLHAVLLRDEFQPDVAACLAGSCDELQACLRVLVR